MKECNIDSQLTEVTKSLHSEAIIWCVVLNRTNLRLLTSRDALASLEYSERCLCSEDLSTFDGSDFLSPAKYNSDDSDWPVHSSMSFYDLRGVPPQRPPATVPRSIVFCSAFHVRD